MITDPLEEVTPSPLIFDDFLERIKPANDSFEIAMLTGDRLRFRHVYGRDSFRQIRDAANGFADSVTAEKAPPAMQPYVPSDKATKVWCHIMAQLSLDQWGELNFLKIQHYAPIVFDDLQKKFMTEMTHVSSSQEMAEIDSAKKGSAPASSGGTASRSHRKSGDSTPGS